MTRVAALLHTILLTAAIIIYTSMTPKVAAEARDLQSVLDKLAAIDTDTAIGDLPDEESPKAKAAIENILDPEGAAARRNSASKSASVLIHYRSSDGPEFPDESEIIAAISKSDKSHEEDKNKNIVLDYFDSLKVNYSALDHCTNSKTEKIKGSKGQEGAVYLDVLYISELEVSKTNNFYGLNVDIRTFTPGKDSSTSAIMRETGVPCTPYRIRVVGSSEYRLYGSDAIKKY